MSARHLTQLTVENFRGFRRLELKDLQAVNLIVGLNNAGKTSLLEAIALAATPKAIQGLPTLLRPKTKNPDKRFYRWLIRDAGEAEEARISAPVHSDRILRFFRAPPPGNIFHQSMVAHRGESLFMIRDGSSTELRLQVISVLPRSSEEMVKHFGNAVRSREGERELHDILQTVVPRITRVRVDPVEEGNIIAVDIGLSESVPLSQARQGLYRLVAMLSELLGERPQVCIIDEIENGIHYSVMDQVWKGIAEISDRLGVQIFATTHSAECLEAAARVFGERSAYDLAVIQLYRAEEGVQGRVLEREDIELGIRASIDLR